ncbi:hypothetical protein GCM10023185_05430 [Hymenobacter saemangeumensis]|uniref:DUF4296 domain-containing protein n=1 Tax=Hymenobacter saemangeumensis TaxID=1084522 RepID=A0ABP8I0Y9_9BACT
MRFSFKNTLLPFLTGSFALLTACSAPVESEKKSPALAAERAVMDRHDSLMVQTGQLFELKEKVKQARPAHAGRYLRGLQAADNAMMNWMHQYRAPDSTMSEAQRLAYFQKQQEILDAVEKQQQGIIDSVHALLQQQSATTSVK